MSRSLAPEAVITTETSGDAGVADHLHLLALCLDLQLDLLLVALPPGVRERPGDAPRWRGGVLDLEPVDAAGPPGEWLLARYRALVDTVDDLLVHDEVGRRPALVSRLQLTRATCRERMAAVGARREPAERPAPGSALAGPEPGHFLG